ncbi:MAG: GAF domain-containing sensor histidine kinase, partial [Candidatus Promineifilaceae bacterium]|nr:GAF domain-containing sensor histidine kinase [Candidatus Promineifilaceae bacterium]
LFQVQTSSAQYLPHAGNGSLPVPFDWVRLIIPIYTFDVPRGLWLLGSRYPDDHYAAEDIDLLTAIGQQIAVAVENSRLLDQLGQELRDRREAERRAKSYAQRVAILHQIDKAIIEAKQPQELASVATRLLVRLLELARVSVSLYDEAGETYEVLAVSGASVPEIMVGQQGDIGPAYRAQLDSGTTYWIIEDVRQFEPEAEIGDRLHALGLRAFMLVPMRIQGLALGALALGASSPEAFDDETIAVAVESAHSLAVALNNVRLQAQQEEHYVELEELSSRLIDAHENERRRISRELHDELGQVLTAVTFDLAAVKSHLAHAEQLPHSLSLVDDAHKLILELISKVRSLSLELRPSLLQDLGLVPTLHWYADTQTERFGIQIKLNVENLHDRLPQRVETTVYRVIQEALTNVVRHAGAERVTIDLARRDGWLTGTIRDDGCGFNPTALQASGDRAMRVGLLGMRERVRSLRGTVDIQSEPGDGTTVQLKIPLGELS